VGGSKNYFMEFRQGSFIVGVNLENVMKNPPSPKHIFADILLIDKTQDTLKPLLYQIKKDALLETDDFTTLKRNGYFSIDRNAFMMIGTVVEIDKKNKMIHLCSEDTVSYNHLILASGIHPPPFGCVKDEEFVAGLHALLEALKVRKNLPEYLLSPEIHELTAKFRLPIKLSIAEDADIQSIITKIIQPKIATKTPDDPNTISNISDKRLYEVVI
jgi:hypothetical protein